MKKCGSDLTPSIEHTLNIDEHVTEIVRWKTRRQNGGNGEEKIQEKRCTWSSERSYERNLQKK